MINEALRCLDEGVVSTAEELDLAMIMGIGFPPFRGGLLHYAQQRGFQEIIDCLNELTTNHGERFRPCDKLKDLAKNNKKIF